MSERVGLKKYLILVGNPGTGKSTILNCLLQEAVFKSGLSFGRGMTTALQTKLVRGVYYGDTPGLADSSIRKKAAAEITRALKQDGEYRIVFVVTLNNGRCSSEDAVTMKLVLDAIPKDVPYGIIVNQIKPMQYKLLLEGGEEMQSVLLSLFEGHRPTTDIFLYPEVKDMEEAKDYCGPAGGEILDNLRNFLECLPAQYIEPKQVQNVKSDKFEAELIAMQEKLNMLKHELDKEKALLRQSEALINDLKGRLQEAESRSSGGFFSLSIGGFTISF